MQNATYLLLTSFLTHTLLLNTTSSISHFQIRERESKEEKMSKKLDYHCLIVFSVLLCLFSVISGGGAAAAGGGKLGDEVVGSVVKRNEREPIVSTEFGEISRVRLSDENQSFQLHFFTLEPNSLLLPLLLHQDMLFFVHTGSGVVSYIDVDEDKRESRNLKRGDIHRLRAGSVFYLQSDLDDPLRHKLRLHAIFGTSRPDFTKAAFEPYTTISDLVLGFDKQVLQQIFQVPEEVIEEMKSEPKPPAIIQSIPSKEKNMWEMEQQYLTDLLMGGGNLFHLRNKAKKSEVYNIYSEKPDFKNCNGWSTTVNRKKYSPLRNSQYGIFMVNLTTGSMMGPHWNPMATEIAVVIEGKGMVSVACSSGLSDTECKNTRISVEEGDAFVVPRYHPMGHMAFNNETFVFVGFSTATKKNHPQFLAGQASVLRTLDKQIVARSFGVSNETLDRLLVNQGESVILKCTSCAEEEWRLMQEERKKEREEKREREQEEARRKEEEQRRRQEEEEARKKQEEEAARQRREEQEREEAKRKEEEQEREEKEREEAKRKEEEHRRQEEERRRQEEEEAKKQEEAERQRREEQEREEAKRREKEQTRREEERRKQEEEEAARQEREDEKEAKRKEEQKRQKEERQKQEDEEAERQRREQQESEEREREASRQQEQEEQEAREREEAARREREEQQAEERERQRQQEERKAQEKEEAARREREEEKERQAREREEEEAREQEEAQKRREEEQEQAEREARQRAQEQERAQQQKEQREAEARSEEEAARREEEEPESQEQGSRHEGQQETEEEHRGGGTGMRRTV